MTGVTVGDIIVTRRGRARVTNIHPDTVEARVDDPTRRENGQRLEIRSGEFARPKSCAILRVLHLSDRRVTNVQFIDQASCGIEFLPPGPPDETRFLFILNHETYYQRHPLRPEPTTRFMHLNGWVDRWGPFSHDPEILLKPQDSLDIWLDGFKRRYQKTRSGILYHLVLDTETFQILWHGFQCENGWLAAPSFSVAETSK